MLGKPTIRMPAAIDPSIVKIAVELENHTPQLIEFDQKSTLTGKFSIQNRKYLPNEIHTR